MTGAVLAIVLGTATLPTPEALQDDVSTFVEETGHVIARPLNPTTSDLWILAPAAAATGLLLAFNVPLYHWMYRWPDPMVGGFRTSYWISYLGEGTFDVALFLGLGALGFLTDDSRLMRTCVAGLEALVATAVVSRVLKLAFREERPALDGNHVHWFSRRWWHADSFPSGHAMSVFATVGVIATEYPELAPFVYPLAFLVCVARIQQRAHWPSDLVVGSALGYLFARQAATKHTGIQVSPTLTGSGVGLALSGRVF